MGLIGRLFGSAGGAAAIGSAASQVAEIFTVNATKKMETSHDAFMATQRAYGEEFSQPRACWFDGFVNGLNRLPRPLLALGTLALFIYAMVNPASFAQRMVGLSYVPEPLWWLLAAIVGFYFGAREAHYFRTPKPTPPASTAPSTTPSSTTTPLATNPALEEWKQKGG
ncbi:holin family protein [Thioclava sp. GXIMD4215]|uniref:holin family protein n=1 Tax=Thioclava sp. GXIMD4215 TaxID=3131928 RepID=UPI00324607AC